LKIVGLNKENIIKISKLKKEADWVLNYRLESYENFLKLKEPNFGPKINIDLDNMTLYKYDEDKKSVTNWENVRENIKCQMDELGVTSSEKYLGGMGIQYESEMVYQSLKKELEDKNIIFCSIEDAIKNHSDLVKKYLGKLIKNDEHRYSALNSTLFSGGSFIYVPKNTILNRPLQSYFRIDTENLGQFERTLIIIDDNSKASYIEGCTAPITSLDSLHAANVEVYVGKNSSFRFTTVQNWSNNVINMVTERALVEENAEMIWIDGNIGSKVTMKYPSCVLKGDNSSGTCVSVSLAGDNQIQEGGSNMIHIGKNTKSKMISKSISKGEGIANYRGKTVIKKDADNSCAMIKCDSLLIDKDSRSDAYPNNICLNSSSSIEHEATISKIDNNKLFYLMTRGISKDMAENLIILGFLSEFKEELPLEYAVELNHLLKEVL
jgi:FeS assembly protein SufB